MSTRDQGVLDAPRAMRPDRRGIARGRELLSALLRGYPTRPRDYIVPQQINVRVAIPYRAGRAIGKFGTVKRNRADLMSCVLPRNMCPRRNLAADALVPALMQYPCQLITGCFFWTNRCQRTITHGLLTRWLPVRWAGLPDLSCRVIGGR
jgi:hypothetical protein